jgi:hypothetical protein
MFPYNLRDALPFRAALSLRTTPVALVNNHHYRGKGSDNRNHMQKKSTPSHEIVLFTMPFKYSRASIDPFFAAIINHKSAKLRSTWHPSP